MKTKERSALAAKPIEWTGDLNNDCVARWAGLMLRAEWMDEGYWWWAVYDFEDNEETVDDSNNYEYRFVGGEVARKKAEAVAIEYLKKIKVL